MGATAILASLAALPATTFASEANGELCSVESVSQNLRITVYNWPERPTRFSTRHQVDNAAAWCTNQLNPYRGYVAASKYYDSFRGQLDVCGIHFPSDDVAIHVYADNSSVFDAALACVQIGNYDPSVVTWLDYKPFN
jgi:hypothetical protein